MEVQSSGKWDQTKTEGYVKLNGFAKTQVCVLKLVPTRSGLLYLDSLDVIVEVDSAKTSGADAVTRNKHSIYFILAQCSCLGSTP